MKTIGQSIQRLTSMDSKGAPLKDARLSDRHAYYALVTGRATLIVQDSNKNRYLNSWVYQTLNYIELEKTTVHGLPAGLKVPDGCTVLRSKNKIPSIISNEDAEIVKSITDVFGNEGFTLKSFGDIKYAAGNKYTSEAPQAYLRNGYLWVTSKRLLRALTMEAAFRDPIEVFLFNAEDCEECKCMSAYDVEFPIDENQFKTALDFAYQELIGMLKQMKEDKSSNASDETDNIVRK